MTDRFDEIAGDYDMWLNIDPDYEKHHRLVMKIFRTELRNIKGWVVHTLEVGCGTGYTSLRILAADTRMELWAIDSSIEMVKVTRDALSRPPRHRHWYHVEQRDILDFNLGPVPEFPIVVSVFILHNIKPEMRGIAIRNMAAALQPGGLLIIGDKIAHDDVEEHEQVMKRFWAMEAKLKDFGPAGRYDYWHQHNTEDEQMKMTETELARHLRQAGLGDIAIGKRCGIGMYAIATARKSR
ncbi:MAG: class I SAM-dependent methyltransferase [Candidatus Moraniibacteriota bacterium]